MASGKAATVLVLGDPGPARDELLLRCEIDVIWGGCLSDALELLRIYRIEACILAPEFRGLLGHPAFRVALGEVAVMLWSGAWDEVDTLLAFLAETTGLFFARYPRASINLPVMVEVHGDQFQLETINLSVSGVAIKGFPSVSPGTRVELCIDLPDRSVYLLARVVRHFMTPAGRQAGLTFTDLGEGVRASLARTVELNLAATSDEPSFIGELNVPVPSLRTMAQRVDFDESDSSLLYHPPLRAWWTASVTPPTMRTVSDSSDIWTRDCAPEWFEHMSEGLSEAERMAAIGGEAPEWAHRVLRLRISLARARSRTPTRDLPPELLSEAYQMVNGLELETTDAPLEVQEQVSSIRASLLRDVLGENSR